jgi:hypothetical protein
VISLHTALSVLNHNLILSALVPEKHCQQVKATSVLDLASTMQRTSSSSKVLSNKARCYVKYVYFDPSTPLGRSWINVSLWQSQLSLVFCSKGVSGCPLRSKSKSKMLSILLVNPWGKTSYSLQRSADQNIFIFLFNSSAFLESTQSQVSDWAQSTFCFPFKAICETLQYESYTEPTKTKNS